METPNWRNPQVMARWIEEMAERRKILKTEMMRALSCRNPQDKRNLLADWQAHYPEGIVKDLLRLAKHKEAKLRIANWDLANFDSKRIPKEP